jgi:hypothetical protein
MIQSNPWHIKKVHSTSLSVPLSAIEELGTEKELASIRAATEKLDSDM